MTSALANKLENIKITQSLLDTLDYDTDFKRTTPVTMTQPGASSMFVFRQSDLDAASYHLARSLEDPLNPSAIKCVFVQESSLESFSTKLKSKLRPYSNEALQNKPLSKALKDSAQIIDKLKVKTIRLDVGDNSTPLIVYDLPQEHFSGIEPSPIVSLFAFRTVKEAIDLSKEKSVAKNATIWCETHATAYELINATPLEYYYLNCYNVPWTPIEKDASEGVNVVIEGSYHYERVKSKTWKSIVFPFGTSFAN